MKHSAVGDTGASVANLQAPPLSEARAGTLSMGSTWHPGIRFHMSAKSTLKQFLQAARVQPRPFETRGASTARPRIPDTAIRHLPASRLGSSRSKAAFTSESGHYKHVCARSYVEGRSENKRRLGCISGRTSHVYPPVRQARLRRASSEARLPRRVQKLPSGWLTCPQVHKNKGFEPPIQATLLREKSEARSLAPKKKSSFRG